jgi:hypothetical protein
VLRGIGDGDDVTNVQNKSNWNCHYESSPYNKYILFKMTFLFKIAVQGVAHGWTREHRLSLMSEYSIWKMYSLKYYHLGKARGQHAQETQQSSSLGSQKETILPQAKSH